ncbi:MAG TPA: fibrobacter succinogenes major paralogous domain-containing protein [Bacteroidales bacterium]
MKKTKSLFIAMAVILTSGLLLSCQKNDRETTVMDNEVAFAINVSNLKSISQLKSIMDYSMADAAKIILTIRNIDGSPTKYTLSELKILQMNGDYFTQKIVLKTGSYKLTEFFILNAGDSTIFATPISGSPEAQNIDNPLPVTFSVAKDTTTRVNVEVLSTEKKKPEDFGLTRFPIREIKTFNIMIGITDKEGDKLLTANLTVNNGTYLYRDTLDAIANNMVSIKDGLPNYTLQVEKPVYNTFTHTYPIDSLKMYQDSTGNLPLIIELEKLTVTDYDGNVYKTVVIGDQIWMAENLKVTHYRNGDPISNGTGIGNYSGEAEPKYYFSYNDDIGNVLVYGRLYTWFAATDSRDICPTGWHLPSNSELVVLAEYLGGSSVAGGKLKETGTAHWNAPNTGATNESGFNGLPGGVRGNGDEFNDLGYAGCHWSVTGTDSQYAVYYGFMCNNTIFFTYPGGTKKGGFSIRCIKD